MAMLMQAPPDPGMPRGLPPICTTAGCISGQGSGGTFVVDATQSQQGSAGAVPAGDAAPRPQATTRSTPFCALLPVRDRPRCLADTACPQLDAVLFLTYTTLPDGTIFRSNGGCQRVGPSQADVQGAALREAERVVPVPPTLSIAPRGGAVTQLPLIVSASDDQPHAVAVTVLGVPLQLHLTPTWTWNFGDGTQQQTTTPGRAYDGTDPSQARDGYYVQHTYRARGQVHLAVQVHWTATATRADTGATFPLTGEVVREQAMTVAVREARAQLIG